MDESRCDEKRNKELEIERKAEMQDKRSVRSHWSSSESRKGGSMVDLLAVCIERKTSLQYLSFSTRREKNFASTGSSEGRNA